MKRLVALTKNPIYRDSLSLVARSHGLSVHFVKHPEQLLVADEHKEDMVVIDIAEARRGVNELLTQLWQVKPHTICTLLAPTADPREMAALSLTGARVFAGAAAMEGLDAFLGECIRFVDSHRAIGDGVLFVEDLDSPRFIITELIKGVGFPDVTPVSSAMEALKFLERKADTIFCVVSDINMPQLNGIDLLRILRGQPAIAHLPVIILTSDPSPDNLVSCIEAGASGFLVKPPKKAALKFELEKAQRIAQSGLSPRLCEPEHTPFLEEALSKTRVR